MLEAFHRKILRINGDAEKTYDFRELQSAEELASHVESGLAEHEKRRATMTRDTADETAQLLAERSKGFDKQNEEREARMAGSQAGSGSSDMRNTAAPRRRPAP